MKRNLSRIDEFASSNFIKMPDITFIIFTYNEEARIEGVIKNFIDFGKILIADNKSTDRTQEIALSYGCDILIREKNFVFAENQEMVDLIYDKTTTNWIYWGFADEMLEKKTLLEIQSIIAGDKYDIINMDRKNYFYGRFCYDLYQSRTNKIFKKHAIDFRDNPIHEMGKTAVPPERIYQLPDKFFVHHFISNNASSYLNTINRYTDMEVNFKYKMRSPLLYLTFLLLKSFFLHYIKQKGYKAGYPGIAFIELMLFYKLTKNMKHYEKNNALDTLEIERFNNGFRTNILKGVFN